MVGVYTGMVRVLGRINCSGAWAARQDVPPRCHSPWLAPQWRCSTSAIQENLPTWLASIRPADGPGTETRQLLLEGAVQNRISRCRDHKFSSRSSNGATGAQAGAKVQPGRTAKRAPKQTPTWPCPAPTSPAFPPAGLPRGEPSTQPPAAQGKPPHHCGNQFQPGNHSQGRNRA